jgi:hypothetical protein
MLNPTINKLLVINPTLAERQGLKYLAYDTLMGDIVRKVFLVGPGEGFRPRLMSEAEIRRFTSNVKPILVPIQNYANETLNTFADAQAYLSTLGQEFYGPAWTINLIKNEIEFGPDKVYGVDLPTEDQVAQMTKAMEDFVPCQVNQPQPNEKPTKTKKGKENV